MTPAETCATCRFWTNMQSMRAQRDALLAALEPIVGQLESAQRSTAPAFLKGFTMNDTESGALLRAIAAAKETP